MIEIRRNPDGSLDEIVAPGFHLEQMDTGHWWMSIESAEGRVMVYLRSKRKIKAHVEDERR